MDLADQIDDYICSFEAFGDITMDTLAMFIFFCAVFVLFLLWLCKFLYNKYIKVDTSQETSKKSIVTTSAPIGGKTDGEKLLRRSEPREIFSNKDVKESIIKPSKSGMRPLSGAPGGGAYTSPMPPIRKRLSRKSPGPELRKSRSIVPPSNVVGPETTSVTWTSQVFRWLYSDLVIVNELLNSWVMALNDNIRDNTEASEVTVEIVRLLPDSPPPTLSNIFCSSTANDPSDMTISFDCDAMPVLQIKAFRQKSGKHETSHYKLTVSRFRAHLTTQMSYNSLKGEMKIEGYPDIRIAMNSVGAIKPLDQDEQQLQSTISEILTTAFRTTVYPVDFSIYSTCPRGAEMDRPDSSGYPSHYDSFLYNMENVDGHSSLSSGNAQTTSLGRRLLVKIIKGEGITKARDPYCVVEMDEPPQKNQTGARQGVNPYWDEHFLFDLSQQSAEILFEVYDRPIDPSSGAPKFLGLGLVGIDELAVGPASSQVLSLQPRPYETENVEGAIVVEFVFIEGAEIPASPRRPYKFKEALKISTPAINEHLANGSDLANAAIRALEHGTLTKPGANPSKSTLIIHSVQRNGRPSYKVELNKNGQIRVEESLENSDFQHDSSLTAECPSPIDDTTASSFDLPDDKFIDISSSYNQGIDGKIYGQAANQPIQHRELSPPSNRSVSNPRDDRGTQMHNGTGEDNRGRDTKRKRDFFGTLKLRLSKSKTRSKSVDRSASQRDGGTGGVESRSLSADRSAMANGTSPRFDTKSPVPQLDHSRRSSLSESSAISGFSTASTRTFLHESSTLVLETVENGVRRHFLVPLAIAQRPRWRRKGTKLHIYNDHTFVAKHLSGGGLVCAICMKSIPRRPGKQGYECRDCRLICHKQCHIRAPQACPNATVLSIELSRLPVLTENQL